MFQQTHVVASHKVAPPDHGDDATELDFAIGHVRIPQERRFGFRRALHFGILYTPLDFVSL